MNTLWHDIRFGLRQLRKSPGFTVIAVLSLAIGIGANTAIFSMINGILYKSLPVRNPHELRVINWTCDTTHEWPIIRERTGDFGRTKSNKLYCGSFPYPAYQNFVEQAQGFSDIFAFSYTNEMTINANGFVTLANGQKVSGNFFGSYGARVLIGRPITPDDDHPDASPVTVLTYPFWQRIYGLDPNVIGRTLIVGSTSFTVIGVLPRSYMGPLDNEKCADFYVPMATQSLLGEVEWLNSYDAWWVQIMGRLAPGAEDIQVQTSLELLFSHIVNHSETKFDRPGILLQKGQYGILGEHRQKAGSLWFLMPIVGLVLLIACTNLAGLLLARGAARQHELAVRAAMGAGQWHLIRQSLTESMILSLSGVCLGLMFSSWIRTAVAGFVMDPSGDQHINLQIDTNVLIFAMIAGVFTALLSGLFPALRAGNTDPSAGLKDSGSRSAPKLRLGKVLVTAQVSMSVFFVLFCGLLCRSLIKLYRTDPGFETENLLLVPIKPLQSLSPLRDMEGFFDSIRVKIAAIPGVRSVALSDRILLGTWVLNREISIPGRPDAEQVESLELVVSDGYFATMGINLLNGRDFNTEDKRRNSQRVAIVNEEFVRLFFPDENPLGQYITVDGDQCQIIGLCGNHKCRYLSQDISPILYVPHNELNRRFAMTYAIRTVLPPMSLVPAVRRAVADIDRNLPLEGITTQKLALKKSFRLGRLMTSLFGSFALLAIALSCVGLYGLMTYNVARRTGEMGIRKALGACPWDVARPIIREALTLAIIGVAIGLPVTLVLSRLIHASFYGVESHDPLTIIGTIVVMIMVAALSAWIPARRAAKIDPMEALRYE